MRSASFPGGEAGQIHGIGLGPFHDPSQTRDRDTVIESGMTITVPTCYRNKKYAIRFEDNGVITTEGVKV